MCQKCAISICSKLPEKHISLNTTKQFEATTFRCSNICLMCLQQEREHYEYIINEGKIIHKLSEEPLDTSGDPEGTRWIFVMSTAKRLYAGKVTFLLHKDLWHNFQSVLLNRFLHLCQKEKGVFQHSSFLAGGATIAAGTFSAENGVIKVFCCTNH